jgi:hypothetical protein
MPHHYYILLMKAGPYCGYPLDEIIRIKEREERMCGKFFWGYGGVFCRPHIVKVFVSCAQAQKEKVSVLFSETPSSFRASQEGRFTDFSPDRVRWSPLNKKVLLVGNKRVPHFAITARNLRKVRVELNLADYCPFAPPGLFPEKSKRLDEYFRYRVDKACGIYAPQHKARGRVIEINYAADLVDPFCVYIR